MGRALDYHSKERGFAPIEKRFFFSFCLNLSLLKTAVSRTHLDVLQRDISIDIGNPMDVGLRHLTRLQKMGDVHPIDRGVLPGYLIYHLGLTGKTTKSIYTYQALLHNLSSLLHIYYTLQIGWYCAFRLPFLSSFCLERKTNY